MALFPWYGKKLFLGSKLDLPFSPLLPSTHTHTHTHTGIDMSHPPHSHPLSQAYRLPPGPPPSGYMPPPPQQPYVSVRIDPSGMPYVDWGAVSAAVV